MAKATIYTKSGEEHEVQINNESDHQWADNLPFNSENVERTTVTND